MRMKKKLVDSRKKMTSSNENRTGLVTKVSKEKIASIVDKFLQDPERNIKWIPDKVEKKFYTEVINLCMESLDELLNNLSIKLFDHEIRFDLVTSQESKNETTDQQKATKEEEKKIAQ